MKQKKKKKKERNQRKKEHNERLIRDIRTLFGQQQQDYYKSERVNNFWKNSYSEYESNGDKNRNLSLNEYLNKVELYLRNIIIDLQNSDVWKIELTIAINFYFFKRC